MLRRASLLLLLPFAAITACSGDDDIVMEDSGIADSTTVDVAPDTFAPDTAIDSTPADTADTSMIDATDTSMIDADETSMTDASEASIVDDADASDGDSVAEASDAADEDTPAAEPEVWVVRVGDELVDPDLRSAKVVIERIGLVSKTTLGTIAFPTTGDAGVTSFTLSGAADNEGMLTRTVNGKFVTAVGYLASTGVDFVAYSSTATIPRVVARIDAAGTVDMSTTTTSFSGESVQTVLSVDGTGYWIGGPSVRSLPHGGAATASASLSGSTGARSLAGWAGQIFGTDMGSVHMFELTPPTVTPLPGTPSDLNYDGIVVSPASTTAAEVLYVCNLDSGIERWTKGVGAWTKTRSFPIPSSTPDAGATTIGCTALAADIVAGKLTLVATTSGLIPRLVTVTDDATLSPAVTTLATSTERRPYRGVAFAPKP